MTNAPLTQSTRTLLGNLQLVNSRNSETLNSVKSRNKFSSFGAFTLQLINLVIGSIQMGLNYSIEW